jgi:hypothetical protein
MYIPKKGTRRFHLFNIVNESGGITTERIIQKHGLMGFPAHYEMTSDLNAIVNFGGLNKVGNIYFPITQDKPKEQEKKNIVPSREPFPFKPLTKIPPKISPRGQNIEKRSFQICKSKIKPTKNDL